VIGGDNDLNETDFSVTKLASPLAPNLNSYTGKTWAYSGVDEHTLSTGTVNWSSDMYIRSKIIVPAGCTLTVASNVVVSFASSDHIYDHEEFGFGGSGKVVGIVVQPGGRLIVNDGARLQGLNEIGERHMWDGTTIIGNVGATQSPTSNQGYVSIAGGGTPATIKDARYGVTLSYSKRDHWVTGSATTSGFYLDMDHQIADYSPYASLQGGGIAMVDKTTFSNCYYGMFFGRYPNYFNASRITGSNFTTTSDGMADVCHMVDETGAPLAANTHIRVMKAKGIGIHSSNFDCSTAFPLRKRSYGITATDAGLRVGRDCSSYNSCSDCLSGSAANTFSHLIHAVSITSTTPIYSDISDNTITNCNYGIKVGSLPSTTIRKNTMYIPGYSLGGYHAPMGIQVLGSHGYDVSMNNFGKYNQGEMVNGSPKWSVGVVVNNGHGMDDLVKQNTFSNIYNPLIGLQTNTNGAETEGLQFKCNTFNTGCLYDITRMAKATGITTTIVPGMIRKNQGQCLTLGPDVNTAPAGNRFYNTCYNSNTHLYTDGYSSSAQTVFYNGNQGSTPYDPGTCIHSSYVNTPCNTGVTDFSSTCPTCKPGKVVLKGKLSALDEELDGMDPEDEEYYGLIGERNMVINDLVNAYASENAYDSAAWLLDSYGKYGEALPYYVQAGMWTEAYTAHGSLPTSTDEEKLYAWLTELQLDLYSIDSTWEDLDSTSLDSIMGLTQVNSRAGYFAGAILEYLGIGQMDWQDPEFDTAFVSIEDHHRMKQPQNNLPEISNINAETSQFSLYPNPTSANFIVESGGGQLLIMSLDGRVAKEYTLEEGKVKLELPEGFATGVYLVKYKGENSEKVLKLVYQP
jgi:hypothetical protein